MMIPPFTKEMSAVEPPRACDVILGRGRQIESHPGNQALTELVSQYIPRYYSSKTRKEKKQITIEIVKLSQSRGVRFLRRTILNQWEEADVETIRVRVGQSIRYLHKVQQEEHHLQSLISLQKQNVIQQPDCLNISATDDVEMFEGLSEVLRLTDGALEDLGAEYEVDPLDFSGEFKFSQQLRCSTSDLMDLDTATDSSNPPSMLDFRRST